MQYGIGRGAAFGLILAMGLIRFACAQDATVTVDDEPRYQVSILPTKVVADEDERGADTGYGAEISFGHNLGRKLAVELLASYVTFETDSDGTDFYRIAVGVAATYSFRAMGTTPFVALGGGYSDNDVFPNENDDASAFAHAGLGILSRPLGAYGLRLRGEIRYLRDWVWDNPEDLQFLAGVTIPIRKIPTRTVEIERVVERTIYVEREPAPPVAVAVAAPPPDSDRDGVVDPDDRCPGTFIGAEVDSFGCVRERAVVQLAGVHFEPDSDRLTLNSQPLVDAAAATLRGQPGLRVEVAGHTDSRGTDGHNLNLSERRAAAVLEGLVAAGIERDRLTVAGYGEAEPIATNDSADGRARNRRVELRVLSN